VKPFVAAERTYVETILDRAARRGDLRSGVDPEAVHALVLGSVFARIYLLLRRPADKAYQHEVTDMLMSAVTRAAAKAVL
jgi:tetrahydromethanopterin S-methyltransferase subunit F